MRVYRGQKITFYDRPPKEFRRLSSPEREALFARLPHIAPPTGWILAVSSTSWTEDEDFGMLLNALSEVERRHQAGTKQKFLLVVITGKGPLKATFESEMSKRKAEENWRAVDVRLAWLESQDYPLLLGGLSRPPKDTSSDPQTAAQALRTLAFRCIQARQASICP